MANTTLRMTCTTKPKEFREAATNTTLMTICTSQPKEDGNGKAGRAATTTGDVNENATESVAIGRGFFPGSKWGLGLPEVDM